MEKSKQEPELKVSPTTNESKNVLRFPNPGVTVNQIFHVIPHRNRDIPTCCVDADYFYGNPCRGGRVNQEFRGQPAHVAQRVELMQCRGATSAGINPHRQPPDGCFLHPPEAMQAGMRGGWDCCDCGPDRCETTEPTNRDTTRGEDNYNSRLQSDAEEELEPPLPLKSDNEWQRYTPFLIPHQYMHNYGDGQYNLNLVNRYPPQPSVPCQSRRPWNDPQNWPQHQDNLMCDSLAQGSVWVNVPQFSAPPVEGVSQVNVLNLSPAGAEQSVSHPQGKRRTISLPDECRNVFITYSSDVSSEMVPFVDFLTKQGFRPAIDLFDNPIRRMDINEWKDSYLKDPLTLIIIAISPKYTADIEGSVVDSHGLHAKYIHSMMQNEFIQQGSLNFRFIPVLFLDTPQRHVPNWLQNTRVYRWPQDTEDLLLRLLREEKYIPPPVPVELTLIIRPVTASAADTL
ncbi:uncharacterized protein [Embiotoca jacksoni]|uniref:uncharacterized protein n=1 Tax=Embiotoca jacksoni TaxID=100190 RepID=UPI0037046E6C